MSAVTDEGFSIDGWSVDELERGLRVEAFAGSYGALVSSPFQRASKRALDIAVSTLVLVAMVPVIALAALLILIESGRPILFRAPRLGRGGNEFQMLKLKKMRDDVDGPPLTTAGDPRFTRVGALLARTKLDELPQLWNVLRGQMTLVGPRPEDPRFVAERPDDYASILRCKQGLTGLSQLAFYDEAELLDPDDPIAHYKRSIWPAKIRLDRLYVAHATIWWDLRILVWSVLRVVTRSPVTVDRTSGRISFVTAAGRRESAQELT